MATMASTVLKKTRNLLKNSEGTREQTRSSCHLDRHCDVAKHLQALLDLRVLSFVDHPAVWRWHGIEWVEMLATLGHKLHQILCLRHFLTWAWQRASATGGAVGANEKPPLSHAGASDVGDLDAQPLTIIAKLMEVPEDLLPHLLHALINDVADVLEPQVWNWRLIFRGDARHLIEE